MEMKGVLSVGAVLLSGAVLSACGSLDSAGKVENELDNRKSQLQLNVLGSYRPMGNVFDESAAEIVAYDKRNQRLFVVNANASTVDVIDIRDPANPRRVHTIDATVKGASANSVAVDGNLVAVAIEAEVKQDNGKVVFYDATRLNKLGEVEVGALPDMVTFTRDGQKVLVANEGEPSKGYDRDPEGSVSVIDLTHGIEKATVRTADFTAFNGREDELRASGVRIFGPDASAARDFEPEYIAVSPDNSEAWVTLQENNAVAVLDIANARIVEVLPLGFKDHSVAGNELDASNKDGVIQLRNWPIKGMYMPDAITAYGANGQAYYLTANEGDARDYDGWTEEFRIKDLQLAPQAFPDHQELQKQENLGRLRVSSASGISNGCNPSDLATDVESDCVYNELYSYGARSFTIWNAQGVPVFDSGSDFERIVAEANPEFFNSSNDENGFDDRSDDKGPEPEAVVVGEIDGRSYAFIGLERVGGIMVYDVTDPGQGVFAGYFNNRDFTAEVTSAAAGDLGPEGLAFIAAQDSPNGQPMLAVGNEVSGTTTLWGIKLAN
ncbi:choice-of-anchor I family protein [Marinobacter sp. DUT-1]|uniref:choice-of-anchor I family protein n=1 Tax=Marinobacter sp. DUT-1 TaxID=3412037 RepID=UPI003D17F56B